jgi:hypothetical protein
VIESIRFLAGERQYLLGAWGEIIHFFAAWDSNRSPNRKPFY